MQFKSISKIYYFVIYQKKNHFLVIMAKAIGIYSTFIKEQLIPVIDFPMGGRRRELGKGVIGGTKSGLFTKFL